MHYTEHYCTSQAVPREYHTVSNAGYSKIVFMMGSNAFTTGRDPEDTAEYVTTLLLMLCTRFRRWMFRPNGGRLCVITEEDADNIKPDHALTRIISVCNII